jgi:DNA-binding NtrC family response regulator
MERKSRVLIVDDEISICDLLREDLAGRGYECTAANDADEALALLKTDTFDIALLDIRLPGMSGVDLLKRISIDYPETACIMLTAVNDLTTAVFDQAFQPGKAGPGAAYRARKSCPH